MGKTCEANQNGKSKTKKLRPTRIREFKMLCDSSVVIEEVVANCSECMESRDHRLLSVAENGASSKSQMSRGDSQVAVVL